VFYKKCPKTLVFIAYYTYICHVNVLFCSFCLYETINRYKPCGNCTEIIYGAFSKKQISFFYLKTLKAFSFTLNEGFSNYSGDCWETIELNKHLVLRCTQKNCLALLLENRAEIISGFTFQTKIRITISRCHLLGSPFSWQVIAPRMPHILMSSNSHNLVIVFNGTVAEVPLFYSC